MRIFITCKFNQYIHIIFPQNLLQNITKIQFYIIKDIL